MEGGLAITLHRMLRESGLRDPGSGFFRGWDLRCDEGDEHQEKDGGSRGETRQIQKMLAM